MRLENKIAIVTGASSGIGKAIAELFVKEGATVVAAARRMDRLEALAAEYEGKIVPVKCDVTVEADILGMYDFALEKFGRIDIVINNAGAMDGLNGIATTDLALFQRMLDVNLTSTFISCKRAIEIFLSQETGGNIVNMASVASVRGFGGGLAYSAAKHGVLGITKNLAATYRTTHKNDYHIRVNAIMPCNIKSEVVMSCYNILNMEMAQIIGSVGGQSPEGEPEDIAYAALYLASDEAKYVNGIAVAVDMGALAV